MSTETPAVRAEQALLGAILSDEQAHASARTPSSTPRVLDTVKWIQPSNFLRPYHAQVWSAITRIQARGKTATPAAVRAELTSDPQLHTETAHDGVLLQRLMEAAPVVAQAPMYGGMLVEASLHREMHSLSATLDQAASTGNDPQSIVTAQAYARTRAKILRSQWERVPAAVRAQLDQPASFAAAQPSRAEVAAEARRLAAQVRRIQAQTTERIRETQRASGPTSAELTLLDLLGELIRRLFAMVDYLASASINERRQAAPNGRAFLSPGQSLTGQWNAAFVSKEADELTRGPHPVETDEPTRSVPTWRTALEGRLLGSLIRDQQQVDSLALSGDEFADPTAKSLYAALVDIHRRGGVVDELTVAWTAQRAGADVTETSPELRQAITAGWTTGNTAEYATELATKAASDKATRAAERIRQVAVDPRVTPSRLLAEAEINLDVTPTTQAKPITNTKLRDSRTSEVRTFGTDARRRRPARQA